MKGIKVRFDNTIVDDVETAKWMTSVSYGEVFVMPVLRSNWKNQPGSIALPLRACAGANLTIRFVYLTSHGKIGYIPGG